MLRTPGAHRTGRAGQLSPDSVALPAGPRPGAAGLGTRQAVRRHHLWWCDQRTQASRSGGRWSTNRGKIRCPELTYESDLGSSSIGTIKGRGGRAGPLVVALLSCLALFMGTTSCENPGSDSEEFGRLAIATGGWTVRVRDDAGRRFCTQAAPVGVAYSSAWSCSERSDEIWARPFIDGDRLVAYGVLPRDAVRVVLDYGSDVEGSEGVVASDGVFLDVSDTSGGPPDVIRVAAIDKRGNEIARGEFRVLLSGGRPR